MSLTSRKVTQKLKYSHTHCEMISSGKRWPPYGQQAPSQDPIKVCRCDSACARTISSVGFRGNSARSMSLLKFSSASQRNTTPDTAQATDHGCRREAKWIRSILWSRERSHAAGRSKIEFGRMPQIIPDHLVHVGQRNGRVLLSDFPLPSHHPEMQPSTVSSVIRVPRTRITPSAPSTRGMGSVTTSAMTSRLAPNRICGQHALSG
jgi:hypothetical protein